MFSLDNGFRSIDSWELTVGGSTDENIHINYAGSVEEGKSDIEIVQENGSLYVKQSDKSETIVEQFSAGKSGEIIVYLPQEAEISFKIKNGSGNMQFDNVSIQEILLVNTTGYVTLSDVIVGSTKILSTSGDIKFESGTVTNAEITSEAGDAVYEKYIRR